MQSTIDLEQNSPLVQYNYAKVTYVIGDSGMARGKNFHNCSLGFFCFCFTQL